MGLVVDRDPDVAEEVGAGLIGRVGNALRRVPAIAVDGACVVVAHLVFLLTINLGDAAKLATVI